MNPQSNEKRGTSATPETPIGSPAPGGRMALGALIQQPRPDRALEGADLVKDGLALGSGPGRLQHDVADLAVGLQVLRRDVEAPPREGFVEAAQRAGHVAVDMDVARAG